MEHEKKVSPDRVEMVFRLVSSLIGEAGARLKISFLSN